MKLGVRSRIALKASRLATSKLKVRESFGSSPFRRAPRNHDAPDERGAARTGSLRPEISKEGIRPTLGKVAPQTALRGYRRGGSLSDSRRAGLRTRLREVVGSV